MMSKHPASQHSAYPCGTCSRGVGKGSVRCHQCRQWFHGHCAALSRKDLLHLAAANIDWRCSTCRQSPGTAIRDLQRPAPSDQQAGGSVQRPRDASPPSPSQSTPASQHEQLAGDQQPTHASRAECVACSNRSSRRATVICGSRQQQWHTACARIPAGKARLLPV